MNKKIGSLVVCMLMAVSLVNPSISNVIADDNANQTTNQEEQSATSGNCGENATWQLDGDVLTITGEGGRISSNAFERKTNFTQVIIEDGITWIGPHAFKDCTNLKSVTISNQVNEIDTMTFYGCTSLEIVNLPDSVISIGNSSFYGCTSLTSINIPNKVKTIEPNAFRSAALKSVTIPNSVTNVGYGAFYDCKSLETIVIPSSVTEIGGEIFGGIDVANLTVIVEDGSKAFEYVKNNYSSCKIISIAMNQSMLDMIVGDTSRLSVVTKYVSTGSDASSVINGVTWSSSNENVAIVDNQGVVTALGVGTATITATTDSGAKTTCIVTVNKKTKYGC